MACVAGAVEHRQVRFRGAEANRWRRQREEAAPAAARDSGVLVLGAFSQARGDHDADELQG